MSLLGSMFTGVAGLRTNSQAMNIIGDNISNVNTFGFKGSKAVFGDLFSTMLSNGSTSTQVGRGTQLLGSLQSFSQGSFETTTSELDMAIDGSGFFIVNDGIGNFYTRSGQFRINDSGLVQTISGEILQGFRITNNVVGSTLEDMDLAGVQSSPQATTNFTLGANLDGAASAGFTFNSPISLFNTVGSQVIMNIQFTKTPVSSPTANEWTYDITVPPGQGVVTSGASGTLSFDTSGQLQDVNGTGGVVNPNIVLDFSGAAPPAATQTMIWNVLDPTGVGSNGKVTAFSTPSNNSSVVQDGFSTGILVGLSVDFDGTVSGLFNNGQSQDLFKIALADFLAPTGLIRRGQNHFAESGSSGQPVISLPETGSFGSVLGSTLELSNVDLAAEFVTLIQTQQAFQASARVITTTDSLLTETVNLTR